MTPFFHESLLDFWIVHVPYWSPSLPFVKEKGWFASDAYGGFVKRILIPYSEDPAEILEFQLLAS